MDPAAFIVSCANCHAQESVTLSRCSRCKWVAYCSKACQGAHWKSSHRAMCAALHICGKFRALETNWWRTRPEKELSVLVAQHGLDPDSMCFFGEVLFLLSGLKPMVMFSNLPTPWRRSFVSEAIIPSGVLQHSTASQCAPALFVVGDRVETPAEYDMSGDLVLVNQNLSDHLAAATATLYLQPVAAENIVQLPESSEATPSDRVHLVSEDELAQLLDYPVALSECREPMVEVGYFLVDAADSPQAGSSVKQLLTSYCASEAHRARISAHFQRYRAHVESSGAIRLQLAATRI